jgi:hypothetical protein
MLMNLVLGVLTMCLGLVLQAILLAAAMRYYARRDDLLNSPEFASSLLVIIGVMTLLLFGNLSQIAIWAALFVWLGEFPTFAGAFYHSAVNFATLGYGDIVMSDAHKLLGPLQAINGVLMIGVSTAALMSAFQDAMRKTMQVRRGAHEPARQRNNG